MHTLFFFQTAVKRLEAAGVAAAENDARLLFEHILQAPRYIWPGELDGDQQQLIEEMVTRRCNREPLAYILGKMWFYGLELKAEPGVFCVRPETETLVETALNWGSSESKTAENLEALDLCSGSGAIALALQANLPNWQVTGLEQSSTALGNAQENAEKLGLPVRFEQGDATVVNPQWRSKMSLVVSNPPYIPPRTLPAETTYEPAAALWGFGEDGMEIPAKIIEVAWEYLLPGGLFLMEHDDIQGEATVAIARKLGFSEVQTRVDLNNRDRFLYARKPQN
ncbi:protein-(glutamine-N5) methyltransferase, release factor-specific [Gleimia coleocanis DSM 15436]|uniref:Protein-(Glutamine-N5) methyltransferase, release factor-specific n=1 Tax=Gleimia coleocanis DSM 15436 TaxID=525245 RepID=C0VZZ5_9ACTO|nr:peptide chain release factor N(5)-glutamine methyltransferase [Gleimia coleocanis]EEH63854.1 protein-(glutamine-N5) methyltransferase, release factor-specific [Gleimia coleocanis DSM 15436]